MKTLKDLTRMIAKGILGIVAAFLLVEIWSGKFSFGFWVNIFAACWVVGLAMETIDKCVRLVIRNRKEIIEWLSGPPIF